MINQKRENYLRIFLSLLCMTFLIYIGSTLLKRVRLDFSEEGLYTLSEGTKSILNKIDSPIKLKLYYSKTAANKGSEGLRIFNNHFLYIKELLRQYADNSRNNITLEVIDPRPDTVEEEDALAYGLKKFNLTQTESYFFGLVAENESGGDKIIEFFDPNQKDKLEYELTKLIYTVLNPRKKNIGIISSMDVLNDDMTPYMAQMMRMRGRQVNESWIVTQILSDFYNVKKIKNDTKEISGIDTLVIIHPKGFSDQTLYAIDQFLMKGGNILLFVDPNAVIDRSHSMYGGISSSPDEGFKKLMDKWGIELKANTYAGDKYLSGIGRTNPSMPASRLLGVMNCNSNCTEQYKDNVSSGINNSTFIFPGALLVNEKKGVEYTPILSTTSKGNTYEARVYELNNPNILWSKFSEGTQPVVLAYKIIGEFDTAFENGPPLKDEDKKKKKENTRKNKNNEEKVIQRSQKKSAIIVFSDVDFISDQMAFKNTFLGLARANDNSTLFVNSVESLSGDLDLMQVRSKGRIDRSFDVVNEIEFEAQKKTEDKVREINANISRFQSELNKLGSQANESNIALIQNEGLKKKKELAKKLASLKRELRSVKREGREQVEIIGKFFQYLNTVFVPFIIIILGIYYNSKRNKLVQARNISSKTNNETHNKSKIRSHEFNREVNV